MTVREILSDAVQRGRLIELYQEDILPGFEKMGLGSQAEAYIAETIERFENPFLNHRLADIAQNHAEKIRRRAGGFLAWSDVRSRRLNALLAAADERVDRR